MLVTLRRHLRPIVTLATLALAGTFGCGRDASFASSSVSASSAAADKGFTLKGFSTPESALYDPIADVYFVSNVSGHPFDVDHDGFLSRVSPDGTKIELRFVDGGKKPDGLSAPKGMALVDRRLFVADIDRVRAFDADTGADAGTVTVPGAVFLNDLASAPDGTVYVTDTALVRKGEGFAPSGADAIYAFDSRHPDRGARKVVARPDFEGPNGIAFHDGRLEMVTFPGGEWITLATTGEILRRGKLPGGMLDGIVCLDDGSLLASSWAASAVYRVRPNGAPNEATIALPDVKSPADIGFDTRRHRVLVPLFQENGLRVMPLDP
ncbi:periplasmic ATP/GTP-binding protein [Labilithrix luteola]|uniref:Periplasmic ATP/GTP-binding protein n=1 Tax=Labilithrix luteola TaxID=1391654 RepID=A0A0K1PWH2_9BACT|nr:hypothetical protein [Labilithrix luteola]AKU97716.1 periplasmic ATP/GTP-binding protein [Labilithrix luteola]